MRQLNALAERTGWRRAAHDFLPGVDPGLISTIEHPDRLKGVQAAGLKKSNVIMDYGCGLGGVCAPLTDLCTEVVGVDGCFERLNFTATRKEQDGLDNLTLVLHGDPLRLPFDDDAFDMVILNLVFPYLHQAYPSMDRGEAELGILREFRRIMRPGGRIFLAERNRSSLRCTIRPTLPDARISHPKKRYDELLRESGFQNVHYFWLFPEYKRPRAVIDLSVSVRQLCRNIDAIPELEAWKRFAFKAMSRAHRFLAVYTLGIVATA